MANLNRVMLIGRLTRDPEVRHTANGAVVGDFGLAVNHHYKGRDGQQQEETTFVDVTAFGRTAELAGQYLAKGRQVFIEGRLKLDQWEDRNGGGKRSKLLVIAESLQFLDGTGQQQGGQRQENDRRPPPNERAQQYQPPRDEPRQTVPPDREDYGYGGGGPTDDIPF